MSDVKVSVNSCRIIRILTIFTNKKGFARVDLYDKKERSQGDYLCGKYSNNLYVWKLLPMWINTIHAYLEGSTCSITLPHKITSGLTECD